MVHYPLEWKSPHQRHWKIRTGPCFFPQVGAFQSWLAKLAIR